MLGHFQAHRQVEAPVKFEWLLQIVRGEPVGFDQQCRAIDIIAVDPQIVADPGRAELRQPGTVAATHVDHATRLGTIPTPTESSHGHTARSFLVIGKERFVIRPEGQSLRSWWWRRLASLPAITV